MKRRRIKLPKVQVSRYGTTDGCLDYKVTLEGTQFDILKVLAELGGLVLEGYDYSDWNSQVFDKKAKEGVIS